MSLIDNTMAPDIIAPEQVIFWVYSSVSKCGLRTTGGGDTLKKKKKNL